MRTLLYVEIIRLSAFMDVSILKSMKYRFCKAVCAGMLFTTDIRVLCWYLITNLICLMLFPRQPQYEVPTKFVQMNPKMLDEMVLDSPEKGAFIVI